MVSTLPGFTLLTPAAQLRLMTLYRAWAALWGRHATPSMFHATALKGAPLADAVKVLMG